MTEAEEIALAKAIFLADYPSDRWERFRVGDVVEVRYRLLARAAAAALEYRERAAFDYACDNCVEEYSREFGWTSYKSGRSLPQPLEW